MRILGLDVGSKTIGVAVSDALKMTAQGITTLEWTENDMSTADEALKKIINEYEVSEIVLGLPKHMDGSIGDRAKLTEIYANRLQRTFNLPIHFIDERLTTVAAERTLIEGNMSRQKRKQVIDKMAAVMILQTYLDKI
ncbi:MAG TPA: Holliday junction resolvase RuvX [Pseudogracilibacillus sp.]|nr:Holliday junction resolvase RuvX [Pseudogracilibacillus sp.]